MSCNKSLDILNQNEIYTYDNLAGSIDANEFIILKNTDINYKPAQDKYNVSKVYNIMTNDNNENCAYSHNTRTFTCSATAKNHKNHKNDDDSKLLLNSTINTENKFNKKHIINKQEWKQLITNFPKQFNKISVIEAPIHEEGGVIIPSKSYKIKRVLIVLIIVVLLSFCFKNKSK